MEQKNRPHFFDLHSHVLFDTDDGARDIQESAGLIAADIKEGAAVIMATPHYYIDEPTDPVMLRKRLEEIRASLADAADAADTFTDLTLLLGNEVLYFDGMAERLKSGDILTLAGTDRTLIEFYPAESYAVILRAVRNLFENGYTPVIAHAERFLALRKHGLDELVRNGAEVQIGSDVFASGLFDPALSWCKKALLNDRITYIGTDMHRLKTRPPKAAACVSWCLHHLPAGQARAVLYENAEKAFME